MKAFDILTILGLVAMSAVAGLAWNAALGARSAWAGLRERSAVSDAAPTLPDIAFHEVAAGVRKGDFVFVDAWSAEEFRGGHIPGALNVPAMADEKTLRQTMEAMHADTRPVVVYCSGVLCEDADDLAGRLPCHRLPETDLHLSRGMGGMAGQ